MIEHALTWTVAGCAFGAGVIVGAAGMWMAIDWVYRKLGGGA